MKNKKWEGITLYKKIANVNVGKRKIEGWQIFRTCLKKMRDSPDKCLKRGCIIALLVQALIKKGAKIK